MNDIIFFKTHSGSRRYQWLLQPAPGDAVGIQLEWVYLKSAKSSA